MNDNAPFDHYWYWTERARPALGDRKGQRCRVLVRGGMNSALVEFEQGVLGVGVRPVLGARRRPTDRVPTAV